MKQWTSKLLLLLFVVASTFTFTACEEEDVDNFLSAIDEILSDPDQYTDLFGWVEADENYETLESDISFASTDGLPSSVDLSYYFPPIGDQGQYGTCVAWAVGYNLRSFLNAKDGDFSPTSTSQQYSPKDMFWAIPSNYKGSDCNGTNFEPALDVLIERGIADMSTVPYENLGDCSDAPQSGWTSNAGDHKIDLYRKVGEQGNMNIDELKNYLADGRAVVIGAKLGDNFMQWDSDEAISYDTYNNPGMQHAYHAMILSGYDDNKSAFRVRNSWSEYWGDDGSIWVDYDFFANEFCFAAFVAKNIASNPDDDGDNQVDPDDQKEGYDIMAYGMKDTDDETETDPRWRSIVYNAYNTGDEDITASMDWNIIYLYYNAYDAEDYEILVYDYYSDDYGSLGEDNSFDEVSGTGDGMTNWWNHIDVPAGQSVAYALYGDNANEDAFQWYYYTPDITGDYYFIMIADGYDVISEANEDNNYFVMQQENGDPLSVTNGVIDDSNVAVKAANFAKPKRFGESPSPTAVDDKHPNTYRPEEITRMLHNERISGRLEAKVKAYLKANKNRKKGQTRIPR